MNHPEFSSRYDSNVAAQSAADAPSVSPSERAPSARRAFSRIALSCAAFILCWLTALSLLSRLISHVAPAVAAWAGLPIVLNFVSLYGVGLPVCLLMIHSLPTEQPKRQARIGGARLTILLFFSLTFLVFGAVFSNLCLLILSKLLGLPMQNSLTLLDQMPIWLVLVFPVILTPIMEELLCRKILLTRLLPFGEIPAILLSSIVFALLHGNLFQFLYAFGIGLLFAWIYLRTGRLGYCMLLHGILNAVGSLGPLLLTRLSHEAIRFYLTVMYSGLEYAAAFAGLVLFLVFFRKINIVRRDGDLGAFDTLRTAFCCVGGVVLAISALLFTALNMGWFG